MWDGAFKRGSRSAKRFCCRFEMYARCPGPVQAATKIKAISVPTYSSIASNEVHKLTCSTLLHIAHAHDMIVEMNAEGT
jgi:hypothetical protein